MGKVTSLFARKVVEEVDESVDKDALLDSVGIERSSPVDPSHMIDDAGYYALLERAVALDTHGTTLPLRVGAAMRCDDYGAFGLAWKSATDLFGSYNRAERYARILTSVSTYAVEKTKDGAFMHLHRDGERSLGLRISNEATVASIAAISEEVSSKAFRPIAVHFKHTAPGSIADHILYFGCPVHFQSDRDALLVSSETLRAPNTLGDPSISRFFETHLEAELSKLEDETLLDRLVRNEVAKSLSEGVPTLSDAARHLGMSGRTLQRRLSDLGFSYQTLVDESRRQLAMRLLRQTSFSLIEVAFMTGFSAQSAFTRAFKRWAGQTPRSFRIDCQSAAQSS